MINVFYFLILSSQNFDLAVHILDACLTLPNGAIPQGVALRFLLYKQGEYFWYRFPGLRVATLARVPACGVATLLDILELVTASPNSRLRTS